MLQNKNLKRLGIVLTALMMLVANGAIAQNFATVTITHTAVNVTTSTGEVLAANSERKWAMIANDSDTTIYCKINAAGVLNEGIPIVKQGSFEISVGLGNFNIDAINCIHGGTGNKVMTVTEGE